MEADDYDEDIDGSIHSIHVRNFFCHDNLEINLNRNVNFIVGRNGSGKSALLTALVVGLGGRASATNRGSNLHSFIKKGANSATVEIKIKNSSPKAFKPEIYGDYITIVRNINASGGSSYKVKSATGEVKSTKFEEVNSIVLAHDIQVDNPISVLNQDDARSFHASDAKKKYSLFRKATNLDQTENNYNRALENCNKAITLWKKKNESCQELEKECKKWKASYDQLQSRDEIEAQKEALQNEYYWSEIVEFEKEAATLQDQYDKHQAKIQKLVDRLSKMKEHFGSNSDIIDKLKAELDESRLQKTAIEQDLSGLEAEQREVTGKWRAAQAASAKHAELHSRERRKVADLEREIDNIKSGDAASRRASLERQAVEAREAASAAGARYATAQHHAEQARANAAHAMAQADEATAKAHRQRDHIRQLKQQLRELESRGNDSLAVYGAKMVELVQRVQQAVAKGEFSQPPRGPIGAHLKLKEKKWSGALEHILGGALQNFCVNSEQDSRKLFQIMGKVYGNAPKPGVTCSQFLPRLHDVRRNRVRAEGHVSALDALLAGDPVVGNYLIDNNGLERVLLVPTHEEAVKLSDNERNVPPNCSKIVTLDCSDYYPAPNYRVYGGAGRQGRFLSLSTQDRKRQVQAEITEAESSLQSLEATAEELSSQATAAREQERAASRGVHALLAERHTKDAAVRTAEAALEHHHAPHHDVLVEELKVTREKLQSLQAQVDLGTSQEKQFKAAMKERSADIDRLNYDLKQVTQKCRSMSEEIDQEQLKLEQGATERQNCQQRLKEEKQRVAQVETALADKRALYEKKLEEAQLLCPRMENPRDKALVTVALRKTQLQLSSLRSDGLSKAQVAQLLLDAERKFRRTKLTLDRLKHLIQQIQKTSEEHLKSCHKMQKTIARKVQYGFQAILSIRNFSGSMDIDHAHGELNIKCTGRESSAKRHAATTSSLSGGERSYSTVAFIMALWDCVELPFYFMDEFDVFMDNVNRKIVLELLVDHALKNSNRQFVFLTPQDTSVSAGAQISIHKMAAPRP